MRKVAVFGLPIVPILAWSLLDSYAMSQLDDYWHMAAHPLPLATRVAIMLDNDVSRWFGLAVILALALGPLTGLAIVAASGAFGSGAQGSIADGLIWWGISMGLRAALGLAMLVPGFWHAPLPLMLSLEWAALAALWLSVTSAYGVQRSRRARGVSTWHPAWLLVGTGVGSSIDPVIGAAVGLLGWALVARELSLADPLA